MSDDERRVHFKVNRYMQKIGYFWAIDDDRIGIWVDTKKYRHALSQEQAYELYLSKKRWWKIWL